MWTGSWPSTATDVQFVAFLSVISCTLISPIAIYWPTPQTLDHKTHSSCAVVKYCAVILKTKCIVLRTVTVPLIGYRSLRWGGATFLNVQNV